MIEQSFVLDSSVYEELTDRLLDMKPHNAMTCKPLKKLETFGKLAILSAIKCQPFTVKDVQYRTIVHNPPSSDHVVLHVDKIGEVPRKRFSKLTIVKG